MCASASPCTWTNREPEEEVEPVYVLFEDFTHVKFYRRSFFDVVEDGEGRFEGFSHVND